jgi:glycerate kinase
MANGGDGTVEAFLTTGAAARIDDQTLRGEVVAGVAKLARPLGIPVIALGGSIDVAAEYELAALGVTCRPIADGPRTLDEAMRCAPELVRAAAARFARMALLARG